MSEYEVVDWESESESESVSESVSESKAEIVLVLVFEEEVVVVGDWEIGSESRDEDGWLMICWFWSRWWGESSRRGERSFSLRGVASTGEKVETRRASSRVAAMTREGIRTCILMGWVFG